MTAFAQGLSHLSSEPRGVAMKPHLLLVVIVLALCCPQRGQSADRPQPTPEELAAARKARQEGIQHLRDGDYFEAASHFDEALKHNPDDLESFVGRCKAYRATERFVAKHLSLGWLGGHVHADGGWALAGSTGQGRDFANPGTDRSRVRASALALLSFAGAGQYKDTNRYGAIVRPGIRFLGSEMEIGRNGVDARGEHGDMISHAVATTVFCSVFHLKHDRQLQAPAQAMVDFIEHVQDSETGGWGLQPNTPGDTVVTGWQVIALESARRAGLRVSEKTLRKTAGFLDRVQSGDGAYYGRAKPGREATATAMGLLSRLYLGWKPDREEVRRGIAYLHQTGPSTKDVQFNFVATVLMRRCAPEAWKRWNGPMRDLLVETQDKKRPEAGSWFDPDEVNAARGGRLYQTTLNAMALEVYYRYLPLYSSPKDLDDYPRPPLR